MEQKPLRAAPATMRHREPILAVLKRVIPAQGLLLEIASGTGEHAAFMTPQLPPALYWQPSDADPDALGNIDSYARESGCLRILPALLLDVCKSGWPVARADAVLCCNMIHIAPFAAAEGLFNGAARILEYDAALILYGPFKRHGAHTSPSNAAFDASLRGRNPDWGVRCLETEIVPLADRAGFVLDEIVPMPANNLTVIFRRSYI